MSEVMFPRTIEDLAHQFGVSYRTVWRRIQDKSIKAKKVPGQGRGGKIWNILSPESLCQEALWRKG